MVQIESDKCIGCGACIRDCIAVNLELKDGISAVKRDCMKCGHCVAICPVRAVSIPEYEMSEVEEYQKEKFSLDPDVFLRSVKFRRSIRKFRNRKIEPEKLARVIQAGRYTETAVNYQDVRFVVVQDQLEEVKELIWDGWIKYAETLKESQPGMYHYIMKHYEAFQADRTSDRLFFNAPALLVLASEVPLDGGLASANMEMMAVAEGLGVMYNGYVVRAINHNPEARAWLEIGDKEVASAMLIGYPDITYRRTAPRRKADVIYK